MLNFKKITLDDINPLKTYFAYSTDKTCDNTVGGTFMWRDYFSVEYALFNETLIFKVKVKYHDDITAFAIPLGKDVPGSLREIDNYCRASDIPTSYCTVTAAQLPFLEKIYGNISVYQEKSWSDYLYKADDITTLAGRKYSGQRNHINYFKKTYETHSFEEISQKNLAEVKAFYVSFNRSVNKLSDVFTEEKEKTIEVLSNYEKYGLLGGLLRANGSVVAFSIGEICGNVLFIHIEKANMSVRGAYQVINNEFAKHFSTTGVDFVNREEDVGDECLRTSKLAYHPVEIIDKYIVVVG